MVGTLREVFGYESLQPREGEDPKDHMRRVEDTAVNALCGLNLPGFARAGAGPDADATPLGALEGVIKAYLKHYAAALVETLPEIPEGLLWPWARYPEAFRRIMLLTWERLVRDGHITLP